METVLFLAALLVTLQVVCGGYDGYEGYEGYGKPGGYHIPNYALPYLSGKSGRSGRDGEKGMKGIKGEKGYKGSQGLDSSVTGETGEDGYKGVKGYPGEDGMMGDRGPPGMVGVQGPNGTAVLGSGSTYVNWGEDTCPTPAVVVYTGFIVSAAYNNAGGGAQYICMDLSDLDSGNLDTNTTSTPMSTLVGVRFETYAANSAFPFSDSAHNEPLADLDGNTVLCAVCYTNGTDTVMVPNNVVCPNDVAGYTWNVEYTGYLMTARDFITFPDVGIDHGPVFNKEAGDAETHFRTEYICVNGNPTDSGDTSTEPSDGDALLAHTRVYCSDLTGLLSTACTQFYSMFEEVNSCTPGAGETELGHCSNGPLSCAVCSVHPS